MKTSMCHISLVLLAAFGLLSTHSTFAYGQAPPTGQSGSGVQTTPAACDNPPCVLYPEPHGPGLNTGKKHPMPAPLTPEEMQRRNQEMRFSDLFSSLGFDEKRAQEAESSGNSEMAAALRGRLARKSGLTEEEAEIVKKIASQFELDRQTEYPKLREANIAIRAARNRDPNGYKNSPEFAALQEANQEWNGIFTKAIADLISKLGTRSFSRLDGYTIHMHDNARLLNQGQSQSTTGQQSTTPGTTTAFRIGGI